jgi:hypothetical protein
MQPNRLGKTTEFKSGHNYLTITEWEDGHCEIEIHQCIPKLLFHSCDMKDIDRAREEFKKLTDTETTKVLELMDAHNLFNNL